MKKSKSENPYSRSLVHILNESQEFNDDVSFIWNEWVDYDINDEFVNGVDEDNYKELDRLSYRNGPTTIIFSTCKEYNSYEIYTTLPELINVIVKDMTLFNLLHDVSYTNSLDCEIGVACLVAGNPLENETFYHTFLQTVKTNWPFLSITLYGVTSEGNFDNNKHMKQYKIY